MTDAETEFNPLPYEPLSGVFDEMRDDQGSPRPIWENLEVTLARLGPMGINERDAKARQLLESDGATFHIYGDPEGLHRHWPLDPIPYLIAAEEWRTIETQVVQRAHLLNRVLEDIYGQQELVKNKVIPGRVIWEHPNYSRACHGTRLKGPYELPFYAADLVRDSQGQFQVLGDRSQIPTGTGYALENRIVMSKVLPQLFTHSHVHRLARFFASMKSGLAAAAGGKENPRVVILTPGSRNESYFEQSYLASYLGYSLVEGSDLFVRNGKVWIKTLSRPEPVDVILRRVDFDFSDPLEFRGDSLLGVSGLTEVARRGNVAIVNPFGAGVLESTALFSFLPDIADFFGLPLGLPQIESWWCGTSEGLDYVLENLPDLIVKSVASRGARQTIVGANLEKDDIEQWRKEIQQSPTCWVGQASISQATLPSRDSYGINKRHAILRTFAVGTQAGYELMQGGLTRISTNLGPEIISTQAGSASKDTWVVSREETEQSQYFWIHPQHKLSEQAPENSVSGRMAENLFWMGRYAERASSYCGLLRNIASQIEAYSSSYSDYSDSVLAQLLPALTHLTRTYPGFVDEPGSEVMQRPLGELFSLVDDADRVGSLAHSLRSYTYSAGGVRDLLSGETRNILNRVTLILHSMATQPLGDVYSLKNRLSDVSILLLAGATLSKRSMIEGLSWYFLDLGRRIERTLTSITVQRSILTIINSPAAEERLLEALLAVYDSDITYQNRYGSGARADEVLDLLLLEPRNPRSILYQLLRMEELLEKLPNYDESSLLERHIMDATSLVRLCTSGELLSPNDERYRGALVDTYNQLAMHITKASEELQNQYFTKTTDRQRILAPL